MDGPAAILKLRRESQPAAVVTNRDGVGALSFRADLIPFRPRTTIAYP
jgi:hypothetical protein